MIADMGPRLVLWELTEGCNMACRHCRAGARPVPAPEELTEDEALALVDEIAEVGSPVLVLAGGEPLCRPDLPEIAARAASRGIQVVLATNGTLVDGAMARRLKEAGVMRCSISLDGATPESHDGLRGVPGAWQALLEGAALLRSQGIEIRFQVTPSRHGRDQLREMLAVARTSGASRLHPFSSIPTACGVRHQDREVHVSQPAGEAAGGCRDIGGTCRAGCRAASGICYISSRGVVQPCGYLPLPAGSVRAQRFGKIWRSSPLFANMRGRTTFRPGI